VKVIIDTVTANGVTIPFTVSGSGPALLLIHGGEGDHRLYDHIVPGLSQSFTVLRFDQRDAGGSPDAQSSYSMRDLADDAAGLVSAMGFEMVHVLGAAFGGMLAQELAYTHPQVVDRLILAGTGIHGGVNDSARAKLTHYVSGAAANDDPRVRQAAELFYDTKSPSFDTSLIDSLIAIRQRRDESKRSRRIHAVGSFTAVGRSSAIQAPTLVLTAREDQLVAPEESWRLAQMISRASLFMFGELGHHFYRQAPALTVQIIKQFLLGGAEPPL
jgi:3-oxoadipate enol-lactonase